MRRASAKDRQAGGTGEHYDTSPGALPGGGDPVQGAPGSAAAISARSGGPPAARVRVGKEQVDPAEKNVPPPFVKPAAEGGGGRGAGARVRARPGWTCNADGSRMPLGPRVEFRIIDYGSSYFSQTLAQATGGFRARENYERLASVFESEHVTFKSPAKVRACSQTSLFPGAAH